jgi:non-ribosomal peptide synthetase component F
MEVPIKSILLASHSAVLGMLSETNDIVTGYEMNARPEKKDGDKTLGLFINVIPFRLKIPTGTWADLVKETYRAETELLPYRRYPLAQLKEDLRKQRLFEVLFNFTHFRSLRNAGAGAGAGGLERIDPTLGEDLIPRSEYVLRAEFALNALSRDVELTLHFHANVFEKEQIEHISSCYIKVLQQVSDNPLGPCEPGSLLREGKTTV